MVRILVADEQEVVRCGLRKMFERQLGWEVIAEASNGKAAISKAVEFKPDVAILDYALPLINGIEATRHIRTRLPSTEVLIFTAHDDDALIRECLRAGARSYLLKQDLQSQLLSAIEFLAVHKPFFTGKVAETLLGSFCSTPDGVEEVIAARRDSPALANEELAVMERSVLQLIAEGYTSDQIAKRLAMNVKLVNTLVKYAIRNGLVKR